jgi:biopolymer transport protein ExbD
VKSARSIRARSISFKITAMIDMTFLLITFFIMSIRFGQQGEEKVKLPNADQATAITDQRVQLISVNVTKGGRYLINGVEQSSSDFLRYVRARKDEGKKLEIVVRGDRSSEFNAIQRIMRLSAEAGVRDVSLAALQTTDTGPVD